jgi:hypothetical protein
LARGAKGQHHVRSYFAITYRFDSGDVTDAEAWGNKTGVAALHCRQDYRRSESSRL